MGFKNCRLNQGRPCPSRSRQKVGEPSSYGASIGLNLHAIHHLWPSIPYYNLPEAARRVRAAAQPNPLEWRTSYLKYLWRYWRALPLEECRASTAQSA